MSYNKISNDVLNMTKITLDSDLFNIDVEDLEGFLLDCDVESLIKIKNCVNIEVTSRLEELIF